MTDQDTLAGNCPICGEQNRCDMADRACMGSSQAVVQSIENQSIENQSTENEGLHEQNNFQCWCKSMQLTPAVRQTLESQTNGKRCICQRCLMRMLQDQ